MTWQWLFAIWGGGMACFLLGFLFGQLIASGKVRE